MDSSVQGGKGPMKLTLREAPTLEKSDHNTGRLPLLFTKSVWDPKRPTEFYELWRIVRRGQRLIVLIREDWGTGS